MQAEDLKIRDATNVLPRLEILLTRSGQGKIKLIKVFVSSHPKNAPIFILSQRSDTSNIPKPRNGNGIPKIRLNP